VASVLTRHAIRWAYTRASSVVALSAHAINY